MTAIPVPTTLSVIVGLLGGPAVMPQPIRTDLDLMYAAAAGVSVQAVRNLQRHMHFTNKDMSEVLSISESTLTRREQAQKPLSRDEAEKVIQLSAVVAHGLEVFENEADLHHWLYTNNVALGGIQPYTLLVSALGREQVRMILYRIQHGIFS